MWQNRSHENGLQQRRILETDRGLDDREDKQRIQRRRLPLLVRATRARVGKVSSAYCSITKNDTVVSCHMKPFSYESRLQKPVIKTARRVFRNI